MPVVIYVSGHDTCCSEFREVVCLCKVCKGGTLCPGGCGAQSSGTGVSTVRNCNYGVVSMQWQGAPHFHGMRGNGSLHHTLVGLYNSYTSDTSALNQSSQVAKRQGYSRKAEYSSYSSKVRVLLHAEYTLLVSRYIFMGRVLQACPGNVTQPRVVPVSLCRPYSGGATPKAYEGTQQ